MAAVLDRQIIAVMKVVVDCGTVGGRGANVGERIPERNRARAGDRLAAWNTEQVVAIRSEDAAGVGGRVVNVDAGVSGARFVYDRRRRGAGPTDNSGRGAR